MPVREVGTVAGLEPGELRQGAEIHRFAVGRNRFQLRWLMHRPGDQTAEHECGHSNQGQPPQQSFETARNHCYDHDADLQVELYETWKTESGETALRCHRSSLTAQMSPRPKENGHRVSRFR